MRRYAIKYDRRFVKELEKIPDHAREKIQKAIAQLGEDPRPDGYRKLKGHHNLYRVRVGDYRICYEIYDSHLTLVLIVVAHRKEIYRLL